MYLGYASYGGLELWNATRQLTYARGACKWLKACHPCDALDEWLPTGKLDHGIPKGVQVGTTGVWRYEDPKKDPAPWMTMAAAGFPASSSDMWFFYGWSLVSITGVEASTRNVDVVSSLTSGAVLGKTRHAAREMVITLLAVGLDRTSVQAAVETMSFYFSNEDATSNCGGNEFHFYAECPCMCDGPLDKPNPIDPNEPYTAEACVPDCLDYYLRRYTGCRVTSGPEVLEWHTVSCCAVATVEMTITAGNPRRLTKTGDLTVPAMLSAGTQFEDQPARPEWQTRRRVDPWTLKADTPRRVVPREAVPSRWWRTRIPVDMSQAPVASEVLVRLDAVDDAPGGVRLGLLGGDGASLGSWYVRRLPAGGSLEMNLSSGSTLAGWAGTSRVRSDLVLSGDGSSPQWLRSPVDPQHLTLVVDRADEARVQVGVSSQGVI